MSMQTGQTGAHGHAHGSACSARDRASELMCRSVTLLIVNHGVVAMSGVAPRARRSLETEMLRFRGVDLHQKSGAETSLGARDCPGVKPRLSLNNKPR